MQDPTSTCALIVINVEGSALTCTISHGWLIISKKTMACKPFSITLVVNNTGKVRVAIILNNNHFKTYLLLTSNHWPLPLSFLRTLGCWGWWCKNHCRGLVRSWTYHCNGIWFVYAFKATSLCTNSLLPRDFASNRLPWIPLLPSGNFP